LALVTEKDRDSFVLRLTDANRVLVTLEGIKKPENRLQVVMAVHDGVLVYSNLLAWQRRVKLADEDADHLQFVKDRLRAKLRFFGQNV
jgi:hypothetical protein